MWLLICLLIDKFPHFYNNMALACNTLQFRCLWLFKCRYCVAWAYNSENWGGYSNERHPVSWTELTDRCSTRYECDRKPHTQTTKARRGEHEAEKRKTETEPRKEKNSWKSNVILPPENQSAMTPNWNSGFSSPHLSHTQGLQRRMVCPPIGLHIRPMVSRWFGNWHLSQFTL